MSRSRPAAIAGVVTVAAIFAFVAEPLQAETASSSGIGATITRFGAANRNGSGRPPVGATYYRIDGERGGRVSNYIGGFQDVLPTLCDLAHVDKPTNIDGLSITPTLFNTGDQPEHKYLYWEFSGYNQQQAVREGKWKIIRSGVDIGDPAYELYDLSTDIGEQHNVAAEHPDVVARLTKYAVEAHTPSKSFPLLAREKPKNYKSVKDPTFTE